MATISLVMIVKNEIACLERCIESVKAIVDEFVIVDTGSTDGTQEIIKKYGTLYEAPFVNYVETKNYALSLAKGDYILFMDADEIVIAGLEFLKEHATTGTECVNAKLFEGYADDDPTNVYFRSRLWKNNGQWKFYGPGVHEALGGGTGTMTDHRIVVRHEHGFRTRDEYSIKFEQYRQILINYLKEHPDDPRGTFYLGRTYMDTRYFQDAITQYQRYLALNTSFRDERWQAAYDIAQCWKWDGDYDNALTACDLADTIDPRRAETCVLRGQMYFELQDIEKAIPWFKKAASLPIPTDVTLFLNPRMHSYIPLDYLVLCYDRIKDYKNAVGIAKRLNDSLTKPDQRVINNLTLLKKYAFRTIFFLLGNTPENVYGGMLEKQGVGGLETTYIELSDAMVKGGHTCFVFCKCEKEHIHNGVQFVPFEKIGEYNSVKPDVLITSRWFNPLYSIPNAKKILWMQDNFYIDPNHPDIWGVVDGFVCSSHWHRQYIAEKVGGGLNIKKIHTIPLAIRKELFQQKVERDPLKVIYSSNPNRGLYNLADMWGELSEKIEGIHLSVTYGWEGLKTWSSNPDWEKSVEEDKKKMDEWMKTSGNVTMTGRLPKVKLAKEMLSSSLCLYPSNFWETFCLTALETQAAGTPMITTRLGALQNTLCDTGNILIPHSAASAEYRNEFIKSAVELMHDSEKRNMLSKECISYFEKQPDWEQVAATWEKMIYEF